MAEKKELTKRRSASDVKIDSSVKIQRIDATKNATFKCTCCGKEYSKQAGNFPSSNSILFTNQTKIKLKCNKCGNIIYKQPVKMVSCKEGCYICSGKNKHKTTQSFIKEVEVRHPNKYEVLPFMMKKLRESL